jgi:hypothetical protein
MNTVNVLSVEEVESILLESSPPTIYTLILNRKDVERIQELCDYYGYQTYKSDLPSVVLLVKSRGGD